MPLNTLNMLTHYHAHTITILINVVHLLVSTLSNYNTSSMLYTYWTVYSTFCYMSFTIIIFEVINPITEHDTSSGGQPRIIVCSCTTSMMALR